MGSELLLILANLGICLFGGYVCICRMGKMTGSETKPVIRAQYVLWMSLFVLSGISWTYESPANMAQLLVSSGMVGILALGVGAWRFGTPPHTWRHG